MIEEEDWIEYIKKKHRRSHGKDGKCEDSMLDQDTQKSEMALRIATSLKMDKKLQNGTLNSAQNTGPTECLGDQEKDGKMSSTNSSNLKKTRENTLLKAAAKSTKLGSTKQKTAEDGLYSKTNTQ